MNFLCIPLLINIDVQIISLINEKSSCCELFISNYNVYRCLGTDGIFANTSQKVPANQLINTLLIALQIYIRFWIKIESSSMLSNVQLHITSCKLKRMNGRMRLIRFLAISWIWSPIYHSLSKSTPIWMIQLVVHEFSTMRKLNQIIFTEQ